MFVNCTNALGAESDLETLELSTSSLDILDCNNQIIESWRWLPFTDSVLIDFKYTISTFGHFRSHMSFVNSILNHFQYWNILTYYRHYNRIHCLPTIFLHCHLTVYQQGLFSKFGFPVIRFFFKTIKFFYKRQHR